jgi:hypothetical protein
LNSPETPGDLKGLCKTNGDEIQSSIRDVCGDDAKEALNYYSDVCEEAGYEVGAYIFLNKRISGYIADSV